MRPAPPADQAAAGVEVVLLPAGAPIERFRPRAVLVSDTGEYALSLACKRNGIPFIELTNWDHGKLYELKGEVVRRGIEQITGHTMPIFEKRRFQRGAAEDATFEAIFPKNELPYRQAFAELYAR